MTNEKILIHYAHNTVYLNDDENVVGATESTTLRTITVHNDANSIYVRKYGEDYNITDVTGITDPVDPNMKFLIYSATTNTLLGSRIGGAAYVDGSTLTTAEPCYLEIEASGGAVTVLATIIINTDVDAGGYAFTCATESVADGDTLRLYLSNTGSTYYSADYVYGGARHVPNSTSRKPYFSISAAIVDPDATGFTITTVLDSANYDEEFTVSITGMILQADSGQTPTIVNQIGARATRTERFFSNNTNTIYISSLTGDDGSGDGTYQNPYATITVGLANRTPGTTDILKILDSSIYIESINLDYNGDTYIEAADGYIPVIIPSARNGFIDNSGGAFRTGDKVIAGIHFKGQNSKWRAVYYDASPGVGKEVSAYDCTFQEFIGISGAANDNTGEGILIFNVTNGDCKVNKCLSFNHSLTRAWARALSVNGTTNHIISECIVYNSYSGIHTIECSIENCIAYNCTDAGFISFQGAGFTANNLVAYGNDTGIRYRNPVPVSNNCICHTNTTWGMNSVTHAITVNYSNFNNNGTDYNANVTSNNEINGDPDFISLSTPFRFGLGVFSVCYRADGSTDDTGALLRGVILDDDDLEINGFIFDGGNYFNNAVIQKGTSNYTGNTVKWCTIKQYNGIHVDIHGVFNLGVFEETEAEVSNCKIHDGGAAIKFSLGLNIFDENIIYNMITVGVHINRDGDSSNHNVFYNNETGIYVEGTASGITIKNSIISGNSLYGINSEVSIFVTYCCITDSLNNVDDNDSSNITDEPLFVSIASGSEDFHIKTIEAGFSINSACKDASDDSDFPDIGAYDMDRGIDEDSWKQYELEYNPRNIDFLHNVPGLVKFESALGHLDLFGKSDKKIFVFKYHSRQLMSEELRKKAEYFVTSLIKTLENGITDNEEVKFRLNFLPSQHLITGSTTSVDTTEKTIDNSAADYVENEWKGFFLAVKYEEDTNLVVNATLKTATKAGAGWTVDEWEGYYLPYLGYRYYIKSNTATVLTLSDPDGTLISDTIANYSIEQYFKILSNTSTQFRIDDPNNEMLDNTGDNYYIDFIECIIQKPTFLYKQARYFWQQETWKTGFQLIFAESKL